MYEEVCLLCGRPVAVDGRVYCSDECESRDATSSSVSTASSAFPSPYLHSANGNLSDVPALVPSALGHSLGASSSHKMHRSRHSISSSSTSSAIWSVSTDDEDEEIMCATAEDDCMYSRELSSTEPGPKPATSLGYYPSTRVLGLSYARRPSGTNKRSTIPTLIRGSSSVSSPSIGSPLSPPTQHTRAIEDSDVLSVPNSPALVPNHSRHADDIHSQPLSEHEADQDVTISKRRQNRASLPAYFSLLTTATPSAVRTQRSPSSLQTLTALTRSFQSSPPTPRIANPILDPITAYSQAHTSPVEATPRGRGRKRESNARSESSRRSAVRTPPRELTRPRAPGSPVPHPHHHAYAGIQSRARLDSIEKVTDWVSHSPAVQARGRTLTRRNSSPPSKPELDAITSEVEVSTTDDDIEAVREVLARSLHFYARPGHEKERGERSGRDRTRGRRRVDETDGAPTSNQHVPGIGNGRNGLRAHERERGRALAR